jgi:hypothetical protein
MVYFENGQLTRFGAAGAITTNDDYSLEEWYEVLRDDVPATIISDLEAIWVKLKARLDTVNPPKNDPVP